MRVRASLGFLAAATAACSPAPDPVADVLTQARSSIGWTDPQPVAVRLHASVTWSGGPYEVRILSTPAGSARLTFVDGPSFGVTADSGVATLEPGVGIPLSDTLETFLRGHDLFLNLVEPRTRFGALRVADTVRFAGRMAVLVTGIDALGAEVRLYYAGTDGIPLGYEVEDHLRAAGTVTTLITEWMTSEGREFPARIRVTQGADTFSYQLHRVGQLASAPDALFLAVD